MNKIIKSYIAKIDSNISKNSNLLLIFKDLEKLSDYVFKLGISSWKNQKDLYHDCRKKFPKLNSKQIQQFLRSYFPIGNKKLPKKPIKPIIVLNYQMFDLKYISTTKYTNYWLRFGKINYPVRGKKNLDRIKDITKVKEVRIFLKNKYPKKPWVFAHKLKTYYFQNFKTSFLAPQKKQPILSREKQKPRPAFTFSFLFV